MSEFINKSKIIQLQQSNSELINEISNLEIELHNLNGEVERLRGENPEDIKLLREKITEYEQRETEFKERILLISREADNSKKYDVKELLSVLQGMDTVIVEAAIDKYYKKKGVQKIITAFLLGILVSLIAGFIVIYLENNKLYSAIIKQFINDIL
ncbi:MAG: hypothetical protein J7K90_01965 [Desulfuromusa sp.]|nr:hypothetical protein [Desulfuromusa sp.]